MSSFKTSQKDSCQSICPSEQNLSITDLSPLPLNVDPLKARCKQERVGGFYSFRELSIKEKRAYRSTCSFKWKILSWNLAFVFHIACILNCCFWTLVYTPYTICR
eukprot:Sdes_comp19172_c0_seq2m9963